MSSSVAIIGIGCMFPKAEGLEEYWSNIKRSIDAIEEIPDTHWRPEDYFDEDPKSPDMTYARRGGFLKPVDFNPLEFGITPNAIEATDTTQLLGMVVAKRALEDAGYWPADDEIRRNVSVLLGVTGTLELVIPLGARLGHPKWRQALKDAGVEDTVAEDVIERIADSYVPWQEGSFPGLLGNVAAGRIANKLDLGGTNTAVDAACASSLSAIHLACMELATGKSDMVVSGGLDTFNDIFMYMCFSKTPALSASGNARPFDKKADGTVLGEGLGVVILKRLEDAERDNDRIYAVIKGIGSSSDGSGNAIYAPCADGQGKALRDAYRIADVTPETIELIEGHGTGTTVGDTTEVAGLTKVFQEDSGVDAPQRRCALGSVKSQIGHTKAAAGAAGLIKAALALHNKVLPPTVKVDDPLEVLLDTSPFYVNTEARPWMPNHAHPRRAGVSSFGFGGSNFHVVLEEYESRKPEIDWDGSAIILPFAANSREALNDDLEDLPDELTWDELRVRALDLRESFDSHAKCRLVIVLEKDSFDLPEIKSKAAQLLSTSNQPSAINHSSGIYFGEGEPGKLAVVFPGQGAQKTGMLGDLACHFPEFQQILEASDAALPSRITDLIYPIPAFDKEKKAEQETVLRQTQNAQPAIGAVSMGAFKILEAFGLHPDAAAGHSFGELSALCASGRFDIECLISLARLRGELMAAGEGDRGSMLAVKASLEEVNTAIDEESLDLIVANRNAPTQSVLSGTTAEIERAEQILKDRKLPCKKLPVSAAFHSSLVSAARQPFADALAETECGDPRFPVYSNSTAEEYPADSSEAQAILASQLACPVEFVQQIENMYDAGIRTFVEAGPGKILTGLIEAILKDRPRTAIAMDASSGKRSGLFDLACALAQLAASGRGVALDRWDTAAEKLRAEVESRKPAMTVRLSGANYVSPREKKPPIVRSQPAPQAATTDSTLLAQAIQASQQNIAALQQLQEQTAALHQQFLEGQATTQQTFLRLIEQQGNLASGIGAQESGIREQKSEIMDQESGISAETPAPIPPSPQALTPPPAPSTPTLQQSKAPQPASDIQQPPPSRKTSPEPVKTRTPESSTTNGHYEKGLLDIVSEKTGYPAEMLNLDMEMDADLGIDSIKRVEILSAFQEAFPDVPEIKSEHLGEFNTLRDVVDFLHRFGDSEDATPEAEAEVSQYIEDVSDALLTVVAEKTGYPVDMLELDMELDSDLGIDSIKRVEILSALEERLPGLPAIQSEHLGAFENLRHVVEFVAESRVEASRQETQQPGRGGPALDDEPDGSGASEFLANEKIESALIQVVAAKTGYPAEMLELDMEIDSDLGIDSIKRVEILSALEEQLEALPEIQSEQLGSFNTLRDVVNFLLPQSGTETEKPLGSAEKAGADIATNGGRRAREREEKLEGLQRFAVRTELLSGPRKELSLPEDARFVVVGEESNAAEVCAALKNRGIHAASVSAGEANDFTGALHGLILLTPTHSSVLEAFKQMQKSGQALREAGGILAAVTRLDGAFGFGAQEIESPDSGGLAGLVKTAGHEWPEVSCRVIDTNADVTAEQIVDELLLTGPVEVGLSGKDAEACRVVLEEDPGETGEAEFPFTSEDVIVITGGARGVTAEVGVALARIAQPRLVLLGRSPAPSTEPDWLEGLTEEGEIKKAILAESNGETSPKWLGEEFRRHMANREILKNLERIRAAGSEVHYRSVDVRAAESVKATLADIQAGIGMITGIIHGAGVLADRLIEDKTSAQFEVVYETKVAGLQNLLAGLDGGGALKALITFASSTARFGRKGQVDYAAANEVLNKLVQHHARLNPHCHALSLNWGPWEGGMVTPALREVFANEGVGLIPLEAGAELLVNELRRQPGQPVELVILGPGSTVVEKSSPHQTQESAAPDSEDLNVAFERTVSVDDHPFLASHVMNGKSVLPMAIIMEWLAHGAIHDNPGLTFHGFNNVRVLKGLVLEEGESSDLRFLTGKSRKEDGHFIVPVEMQSDSNGRLIRHASGQVVLAARLPDASQRAGEPAVDAFPVADVYASHLFHGQEFHSIENIEGCSRQGIIANIASAPSPSHWIQQPLRGTWLADPLAVDSVFQLMIVWCIEQTGSPSLPSFAGSYRQFVRSMPRGGIRLVVTVTLSSAHQATADVDFLDGAGNLVARMEGYECTINGALREAFAANELSQPVG